MATVEQLAACNYVGIVSGNREPDKFSKAGFTALRSEAVNAPIIEQLPMTLECEMVSYDKESNHLVGRIVNVSADEKILTDGKIDLGKLRPITYDPINHHYIAIGEVAGNAFSDGKKLK
jgi:flavin reductase (DIM6/NTAB) family NADH-FMN oxidoreductase RutF